MRICLISLAYPPEQTEGIARQRHALATELAHRGHDVHVVACGAAPSDYVDEGVQVHVCAHEGILHFSDTYPNLDVPLTFSQLLYERLADLHAEQPFSIVDIPLWAAQGFVALQRHAGPTVVWLQTTTAQLYAINGQPVDDAVRAMLQIERACLERASGVLADSQAALEHTRADYGMSESVPQGIAYLGISPHSYPPRQPHAYVEAIVVGRLEKRKGTPELFQILPQLLADHPQLRVRFVGSDNSASDGWQQRYGCSYPEFFQSSYPHLAQRVIFEGYADDSKLHDLYAQADIFLSAALYESFGLTYLEAMQATLPVVAFASGGACEIFAEGAAHGALLAPLGDVATFARAVANLAENASTRAQLAAAGHRRFHSAFSAATMADATLAFYQQVLDATRNRRSSDIYHVMEALDLGDGVSEIAQSTAAILANLGYEQRIMARYWHPSLANQIQPISSILSHPNAALIFHYWNYNSSTWAIPAVKGRKALYYHNITPRDFFDVGSDAYLQTERGYRQLANIIDSFNLIIGDSQYNIDQLIAYTGVDRPSICIYPIIEPDALMAKPYDANLLHALRSTTKKNILFVGRIARNKRQDRLITAFDRYYRSIRQDVHLWLVGSDSFDPEYTAELRELCAALPSGRNISLTGKVSDEQLQAYFRAADLFMCASEHEGFCIPIAQAMAYGIPVIAYAAAAIPETLGQGGILVNEWDDQGITNHIHSIVEDPILRSTLQIRAQQSLSRFSHIEAQNKLEVAITFLITS